MRETTKRESVYSMNLPLESVRKLRGAHVLLVEDNELNQALTMDLLSEHDVTLVLARNGREALARLDGQCFDGILMDLRMPVMDGLATARAIRARPDVRNVPIIAITADAMATDRAAALAAGMNDHVPKPIDLHQLLVTMAKWITPGRPVGEVPDAPPTQASGAGQRLPPLAGVDVRRGLTTAGGNVALYGRLLRRFCDEGRTFEARFRAARADRDTEATTRLAHTLKGNAGTIGATQVYEAAAALERRCGSQAAPDEVTALLEAVTAALSPVLTDLLTLEEVPARTTAERFGPPTAAALAVLLSDIRGLLLQDDAAAIGKVRDLAERLAQDPRAPAMECLLEATAAYDFGRALQILDAFSERSNPAGR